MKRSGGWRTVMAGALALGALTLVAARPVQKKPTALELALKSHVETLASDDFAGREPGTEGETKTLRYLARQWFDIGLEGGTNIPGSGWFAPVELVEREPVLSRASFTRARKRVVMPEGAVFAVTSGLRSLVQDAPLLFVGHAAGKPVGRAELSGRVAVMLDSLPDGAEPDVQSDRAGRLLDGGALAVLTVLDGERPEGQHRIGNGGRECGAQGVDEGPVEGRLLRGADANLPGGRGLDGSGGRTIQAVSRAGGAAVGCAGW